MKQKIIHLVRHAKSDWNFPGLLDRDRPLNARGRKNAPDMAMRFLERFEPVDVVLCSDALRTQETMNYFLDAGCFHREMVQLKSELYHASADVMEGALRSADDACHRIMLFGHNNGISDLASRWTNASMHMSTCAIASFEVFVEEWQGLGSSTARLIQLDYPKRVLA
ncbi:MAG: SixA phosphatase family protein [Flavobacteriales bacterium]